jgi:hypothetical protein
LSDLGEGVKYGNIRRGNCSRKERMRTIGTRKFNEKWDEKRRRNREAFRLGWEKYNFHSGLYIGLKTIPLPPPPPNEVFPLPHANIYFFSPNLLALILIFCIHCNLLA